MKTCRSCQQVKSLSEFHRHAYRVDGHTGDCKTCARKRTREWNKNNADKHSKQSRKWYTSNKTKADKTSKRWAKRNPERIRAIRIKSVYGLSSEQLLAQLQKQNGHCALCFKASRLVIDHDHAMGQFRGLLCRAHNVGLGHLGDSVDGLLRAISYLTGQTPITATDKTRSVR